MMKHLYLLIAVLFIQACSSSVDSSEVKNEDISIAIDIERWNTDFKSLRTAVGLSDGTSGITLSDGEYLELFIDGVVYQSDAAAGRVFDEDQVFTLGGVTLNSQSMEIIFYRRLGEDISVTFTMPQTIQIIEPQVALEAYDPAVDSFFVSWINQGHEPVNLNMNDAGGYGCITYGNSFPVDVQQYTIAPGEIQIREGCQDDNLNGSLSTYDQPLEFSTNHIRDNVNIYYSDSGNRFPVGKLK